MERKHRVIRMGYWIIYDWHNSRIILGNGYNNHNSVLGSKKIKKGEDSVEEVEDCKENYENIIRAIVQFVGFKNLLNNTL